MLIRTFYKAFIVSPIIKYEEVKMFLVANGEMYPLNVSLGENVKLYRVPLDYSDDGLYLAQWRHDEIEPYPACLGSDSRLIASGVIERERLDGGGEDGPLVFRGEIFEEGVSFHA